MRNRNYVYVMIVAGTILLQFADAQHAHVASPSATVAKEQTTVSAVVKETSEQRIQKIEQQLELLTKRVEQLEQNQRLRVVPAR